MLSTGCQMTKTNAERQKELRARREAEGLYYMRQWVPIENVATIEWFIEWLGSKTYSIEWLKKRLK
jgi:hypothetical protein